ncbi:MAG: Gfo/Idh/MocA family protein [Limisphaerales bacterium]
MSKPNSEFDTICTEVFTNQINRRHFIYTTLLAAGALTTPSILAKPKYKSPNEKLNIGGIGVTGKGASDIAGSANVIDGVPTENIVALCDVDDEKLASAKEKYPKARTYNDYRIMLEKEKDMDAVSVSTPDLHHAPAAMLAIKNGKHVYCQKPLTHTIWEARQLTLAARKHKVATQMGNQGHSGVGNRELCEIIWADTIGKVREVHCWTDRAMGWWPQGKLRPAGSDPVPSSLKWDLWLGPAPERPFLAHWPDGNDVKSKKNRKGVYHPFNWRGWWDFGCGALGDMGCHIMDGANWSLALGAPDTVELLDHSELVPEMAPEWSVVRYHFPERTATIGKNKVTFPDCTLTWHDSGHKPAKPAEMEHELEANGTLFIGEKGKMVCGTYGENPRLLPESKMKDFKKPEPIIPRVPGNSPHQDWLRACKGGPPACSNFDVSGPFSETVLLGNLAIRMGKKIEWDSKHMRCKNMPEADILIHKHYRKGWTV